MQFKTKKLIAMLMALVMLLSLMPVSAFADGELVEESQPKPAAENAKKEEAPVETELVKETTGADDESKVENSDQFAKNQETGALGESTIEKSIPVVTDFTFTALENLTYDGQAKVAHVTSSKDGMGAITVKYSSDEGSWSDVAPVNAGTYKVAIDVAEGKNYHAVSNLTADGWEFEITKATPTAENFTVTLPENLTYDGKAKVAAVAVKDGIVGMGDITVLYEDGIASESLSENAPVNATNTGYKVHISVTDGDNYSAKEDVTGGFDWQFWITPPEAKIGEKTYATLAEAVEAATEGQTVEITLAKEGGYTVPGTSKNITIKGTEGLKDESGVPTVVFNCVGSGSIASIPNGATFENVTMNFGQNSYHGFQHAGTINMNNCVLNGLFFSYGDMTFTDCTFNQTTKEYCMWVYSGDTITYDTCTFNTCGKVLNVYNEGNGSHNLVVKDCTFKNESNPVCKPAVLIKSKAGTKELEYNVNISGTNTLVGNWPSETSVYNDGNLKTNGLWDVETDGSKITVTVDGNKVYPASENPEPIKNDIVKIQVNENTEKGITSEVVQQVSNNTAVTSFVATGLANAYTGTGTGNFTVQSTLKEVVTPAEGTVAALKFEVVPTLNDATISNNDINGTVTFRLPLTAAFNEVTVVKVIHHASDGDKEAYYEVKGEDDAKYVEISTPSFSEFDVLGTPLNGVPVAQVGGTPYETLAEAYTNMGATDTIVLLGDINTGSTALSITKSGALDLNGHTLSGSPSGALISFPATEADVSFTISDSSEGKTGTVNHGLTSSGRYEIKNENSKATLTIDGGTFKSSSGSSYERILVTAGKLIINDGIFNGRVKSEPGNVTINGGKFKNAMDITGSITVNGGLFDDAAAGKQDDGTFTLSQYVAEDKHVMANTASATKEEYPWTVGDAVASITKNDKTTYYETLNKATTAAQNGDTVVLLKDLLNRSGDNEAKVLDKNITLDLNGHKIVGNYTNGGVINTYGNWSSPTAHLTITDNSESKGGSLENTNTASTGCGIYQDGYSVLTLTNVSVKGAYAGVIQSTYYASGNQLTVGTGASVTGTSYAGVNISSGNSGSGVIVDGGTINGGYRGVMLGNSGASLTMNSGSITGSDWGIVASKNNCEITIKGGTVTGTDEYGIQAGTLTSNSGIEVTIEGGTVSGGKEGVYLGGKNSSATIKDGLVTGVKYGVYVGGVTSGTANSVTVSGGTVKATGNDNEAAIGLWNGAQLTMTNGTVENTGKGFAIANNGSNTVATTINISGGTVSAPIAGSTAIYQACPGTTTISGTAEITGYDAGIEVRNGTVNVSGGSITSTSETFSCNANSNGTTTVGAALSIAQHTTKQDITVNITGGTFKGIVPVNECNPQENDPAPQVNMTVSDGEFWSTATENAKVFSCVDCDKFLTGGFFSHTPDAKYLAPGRVVRDTTDAEKTTHGSQYLYTLGIAPVAPTVDEDAKQESTTQADVPSGVEQGLPEAVVEEVINEISGNTSVSGEGATNIQSTEVENKLKAEIEKTTGVSMVDSTSQLKITVKSVATTTEKTQISEISATTITTTKAKYDVKPWVTIETTTESGTTTVTRGITNEELAAANVTINFRLAVPASMKSSTVIVKHYPNDTGTGNPDWTRSYPVQGSGDNRYVELEADSFSVYEIEDLLVQNKVAVNENTGTAYDTLAAAIEVATDGQTVTLLKTCEENIVETITASITINGNGNKMTGGMKLDGSTDKDLTVQNFKFETKGLDISGFDEVTVKDNEFKNITGSNRYSFEDAMLVQESGKVTITGNTIDGADEVGINARDISGALTITNNTVKNTAHNSVQIVKGNQATMPSSATVTGNTFESWGIKAVGGKTAIEGRALRGEVTKLTFTGNVMKAKTGGAPEQYVKLTTTADSTTIDASQNYWDGYDPAGKIGTSDTAVYLGVEEGILDEITSYYKDAAKANLIEYVALNVQTKVPYTVLETALSEAKKQVKAETDTDKKFRTVILLKNLTGDKKVDLVEVAPGVTFDLNGHNLEAETTMAWGLVKNSDSTGKLITAQDHFEYFGGKKMAASNENVMPVWDTTGGTNGYVFYAVSEIKHWALTNNAGDPKYMFQPKSNGVQTVLGENSGVRVYVDFSYTQTDANNQTHQNHLTVEFGRSYLTQFLANHDENGMFVTLLGTEGVSNITAKSYLKAEKCNFSIESAEIDLSGKTSSN